MTEWRSKHVFSGKTRKEIVAILESNIRYCKGWRGNYMSGWCSGDVDWY